MTTRVKGMAGLQKALQKGMKDLDKKVQKAAHKACAAGKAVVSAHLERRDSIKKGLEVQDTDSGSKLVSTAPWSGFVEEGTRPHLVPFQALYDWAESRGFKDPGAVAKSVQEKIATRGTVPVWFMRSSVDEIRAAFDRILKGESEESS